MLWFYIKSAIAAVHRCTDWSLVFITVYSKQAQINATQVQGLKYSTTFKLQFWLRSFLHATERFYASVAIENRA